MSRRELIRKLIAGDAVERCGFWLGNPDAKTWPLLHAHAKTTSEEEFRVKAGDDCRWICPQVYPDLYQHPNGLGLFEAASSGLGTTEAYPLARCETIAEVEAYPWPEASYLNFDACLEDLRKAGDVYRMSGFWTCFYHNIADLFGMEEYFVKMYTHPEIVHAVTDKICQFYYDANERFFMAAGDEVDAFFFGNDFGTQISLLCGPDQFGEYIMPWLRKFTAQGHRWGHQVILHSCGSIHPIIEMLIEAGVNCLHPLQALAANMDADTLARDFKGRLAFMGGIDAQQLMTHGTPDQIEADVRRVKRLLGPNLIISPSHEAILPNVPPQNVTALIRAATANDD